MFVLVRKVLFAFVLLVVLLLIGTAGYHFVEGWSLFDSLYMSVIVITTLGFMEVHPLSQSGRLFTIFYSLSGIVGFIGVFGIVGTQIIESYFSLHNRRKRMLKELFSLRQHYIVCGCGKVGKNVIETLLNEKKRFVGVDIDAKTHEQLKQEFDMEGSWLLEGDATDEDILKQAGIERAFAIFCCIRDDIKNLFIAMSAKQLNPHIKIAAYVIDDKNLKKFSIIGVDEIISGDFLIGKHLASSILNKNFLSFVGEAELNSTENVFMGEVIIEPDSLLISSNLREAHVYQKTGLLVFAVRRGDTTFYNPNPEHLVLESGDRLVVVGGEEQIKSLERYVNK